MKSNPLPPAIVLLMFAAASPHGIAAPTLTSEVLLRGFYYPAGSSSPFFGERSFSSGTMTTLHDRVNDSQPSTIYPGYVFESDAFATASHQTGLF